MPVGLDVGTSFIIKASESDESVSYTEFRDAFYRMKPATALAGKMLEKGLVNTAYFKDQDGSLIVVGQDAINKAIERNSTALRPLRRGVVNPDEAEARKVLKFIFTQLVGKPETPGDVLVFSVPAEPVDQNEEEFNTGYHEDVLKKDLGELGWNAQPLNEAEAICYSELEDDEYTGICLSFGAGMVNICVMSSGEPVLRFSTTKCLSKDFPVFTSKGVKPISDIKPGDIVLDRKGNNCEVIDKINNGHRDKLYRIKLKGISEPMDMTNDHLVWVKQDREWKWLEQKKLRKGDRLGVPIIKPQSNDVYKSLYMYRENDKDINLTLSRKAGKFIGRMLGNGSIYFANEHDGRISCSFHQYSVFYNETDFINEVKSLFNKECYIEKRDSEKCNIVKFNSKPIAKFLQKLLYSDKDKVLSIPVQKIPHQMALGIAQGLFASDGYQTNGKFCFENTSSSLVFLLRDLIARFGVRSSIEVREPRIDGTNKLGKKIVGTKKVYKLSVQKQVDNYLLKYLFSLKDDVNLPITDLDYLEYPISSIEEIEYNDDVYDLTIASETHSFCSYGGVVHNCGDWVDRMAAQSTAQKDTVVQVEKENGEWSIGEENENPILSAVSSYYVRLIDYTVQHLAHGLLSSGSLPKFSDPVTVVVSGGTSRAKGFVAAFEKRLSQENLPLQIKEVRLAKDPLRAVARGCMLVGSMQ